MNPDNIPIRIFGAGNLTVLTLYRSLKEDNLAYQMSYRDPFGSSRNRLYFISIDSDLLNLGPYKAKKFEVNSLTEITHKLRTVYIQEYLDLIMFGGFSDSPIVNKYLETHILMGM